MSGSIGAASNYHAGRSANPCPGSRPGRWRLTSKLEFGPLASAVPCARLHAKNIFREWDLAHVADDAELIVSELMTNARAPRGALSYPRCSREELEGGFWV